LVGAEMYGYSFQPLPLLLLVELTQQAIIAFRLIGVTTVIFCGCIHVYHRVRQRDLKVEISVLFNYKLNYEVPHNNIIMNCCLNTEAMGEFV
jgi:hypothetical protein